MNETDWGHGLPLNLLLDDCRNQESGPFDHESLNAMLLICGAEETSKASSVNLKRESSTTTPATPATQQGGADDTDSDAEDKRTKSGDAPGSSKRGRESGGVPKSKACREKARREKINDRFLDLAKLIDPTTTDPKIDKATILCDAIKFVQQQTVENHQLRQLNKFLEERVSHAERERGQHLYQMSMQPNPHMLPPTPHMMHPQTMLVTVPHGMSFSLGGASTSGGMMHPHMPHQLVPHMPSMPRLPPSDPQQQQQQHHHHQQAHPHVQQHHPAGPLQYLDAVLQPQQQQHHPMQQQQALHPTLSLPQHQPQQAQQQQVLQPSPLQQAVMPPPQYSYHHPMVGKPSMGGHQPALGLPAGGYWLPPQMVDSVHDSMMRPPAA